MFQDLDYVILDNEIFYVIPVEDVDLDQVNRLLSDCNYSISDVTQERLMEWDGRYKEVLSQLDLDSLKDTVTKDSAVIRIAMIGSCNDESVAFRQLAHFRSVVFEELYMSKTPI